MAFTCNCTTILNTGTPAKQSGVKNSVKLLLSPDITFGFTAATILQAPAIIAAKLIEPDPAKRFYMVGGFTIVTDIRAEPSYETYPDGSRAVTQQGLRTFMGSLINHSPYYQKVLNSFSCGEFAVYGIDNCGAIVGRLGRDASGVAMLYPVVVSHASNNAAMAKASNTEAGKISMTFDYSQLEQDQNLAVSDSSLWGGTSLLSLKSPIGILAQVSNSPASLAQIDVLATINFGGFPGNVPATGLVGFVLKNATTGAVVPIISTTEVGNGLYTLAIAAASPGILYELSLYSAGKIIERFTFTQ